MFDLFRFIMLRPPEKNDDQDTVPIANDSELHEQLKRAREEKIPLAAMREVAEGFVQSTKFVGQPGSIRHADALKSLHAALLAEPDIDLSGLKALIQNAFDKDTEEVTGNEAFQSDKAQVQDSLLAMKLASSVIQTNQEHLPLYARLINLVERTANNDLSLNENGAVQRALISFLILPTDLFPLPSPLDNQPPRKIARPVDTPDASRVAVAEKRVATIEDTLSELSTIDPDDFSRPEVEVPLQIPPSSTISVPSSPGGRGFLAQLFRWDNPITSTQLESTEEVTSIQTSVETHFTLGSESLKRFQPESQALLNELKLDLTKTPVPTAIGMLRIQLSKAQQELANARATFFKNNLWVGQQLFPLTVLPDLVVPMDAPAPLPPLLPHIHGYIKPVGLADLLVVKYQLLRYERGEVAYIENVLKGESSERSVRRLESTEETTVLEMETTKEEERDLQSTERFELQNETENTVSAEGNLKSGNAFSPSYGPMLEFQGGTGSPVTGSQTQAARQASNYSREVTARSASRVTERVRKQVTLRRLREFEEKNTHSYNNTEAGAANISGVFQWVDKVFQGQVFNYGRRLMFDIMIPEPAAFVQQALTANTLSKGQGLIKPPEFKLSPANINEGNYLSLVQQYGANRVRPAPAFSTTISKNYKIIIPPGSTRFVETYQLDIPAGYAANSAYVIRTHSRLLTESGYELEVIVGKQRIRWRKGDFLNQSKGLNGEETSITVSIRSRYMDHYNVSIEVICIRTPQAYQSWQLETHAAILQAYNSRLDEYEERLANLQASARIEALGKNPEENRKIIKEELKKSCISVFTYQHFDIFGAVEQSPQGFLQIKPAEAESQGNYIRFFEQAFEWEQMIYLFYPYFWGTKFFWLFKLQLEESDPHFKEFLKAGEARVTVPVRPGFEEAVAHYLETGEIWNGSDLLDVTSNTYLPILQEIQERDATSKTEAPYGDSWEIRLPTTLVSLRDDGKLPRWREEPAGSGHWVEE